MPQTPEGSRGQGEEVKIWETDQRQFCPGCEGKPGSVGCVPGEDPGWAEPKASHDALRSKPPRGPEPRDHGRTAAGGVMCAWPAWKTVLQNEGLRAQPRVLREEHMAGFVSETHCDGGDVGQG